MLAIQNGQGTPTVNVARVGTVNGFENATVVVTNACGQQITYSVLIAVGSPAPSVTVTLNCPDGQAIANTNGIGGGPFTWHLVDAATHQETIYSNYGAVINFRNLVGTHNIGVTYNSACGISDPGVVYNVYCSSGTNPHVILSPNPTSGTVAVTITKDNQVAISEISTSKSTTGDSILSGIIVKKGNDSKNLKSSLPLINKIEVYNNLGILLKVFDYKPAVSSKQFIDLRNQQDGIYELVIITNNGTFHNKLEVTKK